MLHIQQGRLNGMTFVFLVQAVKALMRMYLSKAFSLASIFPCGFRCVLYNIIKIGAGNSDLGRKFQYFYSSATYFKCWAYIAFDLSVLFIPFRKNVCFKHCAGTGVFIFISRISKKS